MSAIALTVMEPLELIVPVRSRCIHLGVRRLHAPHLLQVLSSHVGRTNEVAPHILFRFGQDVRSSFFQRIWPLLGRGQRVFVKAQAVTILKPECLFTGSDRLAVALSCVCTLTCVVVAHRGLLVFTCRHLASWQVVH